MGEELRVSPVPVLSRLTGEEIWLSRGPEELKGDWVGRHEWAGPATVADTGSGLKHGKLKAVFVPLYSP